MGTQIRLCGRFEVQLRGERIEDRLPGRQGPLVVALLAMHRARPVSRSELIDVLWPADLPADPDEALSALLAKVRRAVGHDVLVGRRDLSLALPDDAEIDVEVVRRAIDEADRALTGSDDATTGWEAAQQAVEIMERGFLVGFDSPWVHERRAELDDLRLRALELVGEAGLRLGGAARLHGVEQAARALVHAVPLRESGHRLLMEALAHRGELAEALSAYERLRVLLRNELGTSPGPRVRDLHGRLLAGDLNSAAATSRGPSAPRRSERPPLPRALTRRAGTAFVGRTQEAAQLADSWAAAGTGHGGIVLVAGGPGMGKTRLASELAQVATADGTVLYGGCEEDAVVAYQPFVEALRHLVRHAPPTADLGPGAAELAGLVPELRVATSAAPAATDDPETRRYFLFDAVVALLADASQGGPVLLVLDDLHWADRATLRLLGHVLRSDQLAHVLIIGTYRDSDLDAGHPLAELIGSLRRGDAFKRIDLAGLDEIEVSTLIAEHAGHEVSPALGRAIQTETDGNPFFVGEVVRHFVETGVDLDAAGRAAHVERTDVGVPEGVREVLELRLGRLSDGCRAILSAAAILGRQFRLDLLTATAAVDTEPTVSALEEALGARLVAEQRGGGEPEYVFVHALVRETLYDGLSAPRAQRLHARAALAIAEVNGLDDDARLAALALHSRLAGAAGDARQSVEYSLRAGDRARQLCAWDEALAHLDGALAIMERAGAEPAHRARLLIGLAELAVVVGDLPRHIAYLERALALTQALGDPERTAQVHSRLGVAHAHVDSIVGGQLDIRRAFEHFDAAGATLDRGRPRTSRGHLDTGRAWAMTYALQIGPGREAAQRAMTFAEQTGDELLWTSAAQPYAWHSIVGGNLREGFAVLDRAFEIADRHQRAFPAWMATNTRGQLTWGLGAPGEARDYLARTLTLPYVGKTAFRQEIADGLGRCALALGDVDAARRELPDARGAWISHALAPLLDLWDGEWDRLEATARSVLSASQRSGNRWDEWASLHLLGQVHLRRGDPARAVAALQDALAIVVDGGAVYFELWVRPDLACALTATDDLTGAQAQIDRCRAMLDRGEDWRGRAGAVALAEGIVLAAERRDEAADRYAAAEQTFRAHGLVLPLASALHHWGVFLIASGDPQAAREKLTAADQLYVQHGAGAAWREPVAAALASLNA